MCYKIQQVTDFTDPFEGFESLSHHQSLVRNLPSDGKWSVRNPYQIWGTLGEELVWNWRLG
jgi:hypothetical protein